MGKRKLPDHIFNRLKPLEITHKASVRLNISPFIIVNDMIRLISGTY